MCANMVQKHAFIGRSLPIATAPWAAATTQRSPELCATLSSGLYEDATHLLPVYTKSCHLLTIKSHKQKLQ